MATADFTATHKELSEQFPCTGRPFAVWYDPDVDDNLHWCVNGEDGSSFKNYRDMAVALKTAAKMGAEWDEEARKQRQYMLNIGHPEQSETPVTQTKLLERTREHCENMQRFIDLAEREISHHNNTDFDGMEFLIKAVKAETILFDNFVFAAQGGAA